MLVIGDAPEFSQQLFRVGTVSFIFLSFFFFEVYLIYNVVLVSGIQPSDSVIFFFRFFSIIGYYKILNIVPCAIQ